VIYQYDNLVSMTAGLCLSKLPQSEVTELDNNGQSPQLHPTTHTPTYTCFMSYTPRYKEWITAMLCPWPRLQ